jgi:hypothetical protein
MASYSVQMTPATRAAAGPFRAELLAADYGPLTGYAQHAVATDMRAFAALCKQSRWVCLGLGCTAAACVEGLSCFISAAHVLGTTCMTTQTFCSHTVLYKGLSPANSCCWALALRCPAGGA